MSQRVSERVSGGTVHRLPRDLGAALRKDTDVLALWQDCTPLGRNEFICWVTSAKKDEIRAKRIRRTAEELVEGKRRPCCWPGCSHRERNRHA